MHLANPFTRERLRPRVELRDDHLRLIVPRTTAVLGLQRTLVVPYSMLLEARAPAEAPWPRPFHLGRVGLHAPGAVVVGHFWVDGERRYYSFFKGDRVLDLRLGEGAPYDRLVFSHEDPEGVAREVRARMEAVSALAER